VGREVLIAVAIPPMLLGHADSHCASRPALKNTTDVPPAASTRLAAQARDQIQRETRPALAQPVADS